MTQLELLAPARNAEIGIAAIDCGADAVYIAGPAFGARQNAGNSTPEIARLCRHASRYGARVFVTLNTILLDSELDSARKLMFELQSVGVSAFIVQDLSLLRMARESGLKIPLHASTQCAIRTLESARMYEAMGFSRLVLERQLSLGQIREIREGTSVELEFFVHGALCVCYSGQCYLSENIAHRSANRGECVQACRSRYDLIDGSGRVLLRDKALLSLKDYNLLSRLGDLADVGICSFKIEGRLKNISYVRNVTREYSQELDRLVANHPDKYRRASYGIVSDSFVPNLSRTFNRGYTELFLDGKRTAWAAMAIPKGRGEDVGVVRSVKPLGRDQMEIQLNRLPEVELSNGDGFSFYSCGEVVGFRGDICRGSSIICKAQALIRPGVTLYRNVSQEFERELNAHGGHRDIPVSVSLAFSKQAEDFFLTAKAESQDGRSAVLSMECGRVLADNQSRMRSLIESQIGKRGGDYSFTLVSLFAQTLPLLSTSFLNGLRRSLAEELDKLPCLALPLNSADLSEHFPNDSFQGRCLDYKSNISNSLSALECKECGAEELSPAYEIEHPGQAELMRTKYCVRYELGMCLKHSGTKERGPLFLTNNGRRFALGFDCANCEMTLKEASSPLQNQTH